MTAESVSPDEPAEMRRRSWNLALLTPTEPGRRNRRTVDAFVAKTLPGSAVAGVESATRPDRTRPAL